MGYEGFISDVINWALNSPDRNQTSEIISEGELEPEDLLLGSCSYYLCHSAKKKMLFFLISFVLNKGRDSHFYRRLLLR